VAYSHDKLALCSKLRNSFRDIRVHTYDFLKFLGFKVGNFFLGQSIGIDKNNAFQLKILF